MAYKKKTTGRFKTRYLLERHIITHPLLGANRGCRSVVAISFDVGVSPTTVQKVVSSDPKNPYIPAVSGNCKSPKELTEKILKLYKPRVVGIVPQIAEDCDVSESVVVSILKEHNVKS